MKKIVVFTGAGISIPLGLPAVSDFNSKVDAGAKNITKFAKTYISSIGHAGDVEWLLATLADFSNKTSFVESITPQLMGGYRLFNAGKDAGDLDARFSMIFSNAKVEARNEITRIKRIVYEMLCGINPENCLSLYSFLYKEIGSVFQVFSLSIVTTNYDLAFETSFDNYEDDWDAFGVNDVEYMFPTKRQMSVYDPSVDFDWAENKIEYLKIHGSLGWQKDNRGRCTRSMSVTPPANPDDMPILYPGFKGVPSQEPFKSLHDRFFKRLMEADHVIVIGFAFRDEYINGLFESIMRARDDLKIFYFNPAKVFPADSVVERFKSSYPNQFLHIQRGIGLEENSLKLAEEVAKITS